jgi:hypothetical protein
MSRHADFTAVRRREDRRHLRRDEDEVYALTAYILAKNKLIGETEIMNAETLPKVRMPNRNGFIIRFPYKI